MEMEPSWCRVLLLATLLGLAYGEGKLRKHGGRCYYKVALDERSSCLGTYMVYMYVPRAFTVLFYTLEYRFVLWF